MYLVCGRLLFSRVEQVQLWWLLVTTAVSPDFWAEQRSDEGKLVKLEARQLGGSYV